MKPRKEMIQNTFQSVAVDRLLWWSLNLAFQPTQGECLLFNPLAICPLRVLSEIMEPLCTFLKSNLAEFFISGRVKGKKTTHQRF